MSEILIKASNLSKNFKDFWGRTKVEALRDVSFELHSGTVLGLLGPNGAGKTTLMKIILGHLYPTNGIISVMGKHPSDVEAKSKIGYVPERATLYKHLTATEVLKFFGEILELPSDIIKSRSDQLLDMVGLHHAKNRLLGEFSHGMSKRMGIAQALLNDPDLLLLDEPTAGLDPLGCREVKDLILILSERGKTVLLTSHLLADVEDVSDELLMIYGGQVQANGKSADLLSEKDMLQITMPRPKQEIVNKLEKTISELAPDSRFSSPTKSLEHYFLDIVEKASKTQDTYGARMGAGVADYLKNTGDETKISEQPQVEDVTKPAEKDPVVEQEKPAENKLEETVPEKEEVKEALVVEEDKSEESIPVKEVVVEELVSRPVEAKAEELKKEVPVPVKEKTVAPDDPPGEVELVDEQQEKKEFIIADDEADKEKETESEIDEDFLNNLMQK
ncbi:MAG: ATP-binding cassette domain-containing protein [Lentisphaeria bacterium]|nr:ATP-binding cassette domain-containing protein [Lentisphaeria bacterium]NQZ66991.1 ATP-binding cassette domain-containing protein [Lentisphaeria bacterium]